MKQSAVTVYRLVPLLRVLKYWLQNALLTLVEHLQTLVQRRLATELDTVVAARAADHRF